jgi:multisubunit Na+/H+ antiporter MnhC subunit
VVIYESTHHYCFGSGVGRLDNNWNRKLLRKVLGVSIIKRGVILLSVDSSYARGVCAFNVGETAFNVVLRGVSNLVSIFQ